MGKERLDLGRRCRALLAGLDLGRRELLARLWPPESPRRTRPRPPKLGAPRRTRAVRSAALCKCLRTRTTCSKDRRRGKAGLPETETNPVAAQVDLGTTKLDLAAARVNPLAVEVDLKVANLDSETTELVLVLSNLDSVTEELVLEEAAGVLSTRLCASQT